ncbi:glutamine amidotransferase [Schaalia sp. 19OD2882]|uniref:type 1 glutamine amidotransferase n=1 Tax=Schaalia sp. 19OD2882 TaxID=2794089 RepID=UPI001C1EACDB|nr:glutamine amidotransferase [Schaalia sp. 19OD2882]QWW19332.1 glutamine amidotransferase [Schaalia sp. 19OD2882]
MNESTLRIGVLMPTVLGTYGDTGNAVVLRERARRRGIAAEIVMVDLDDPIPSDLDVYTLGGGEDTAQSLAAAKLRGDKGLRRGVEGGAPLLAICASLQVLGRWYRDAEGRRVAGLELLDVTTDPQGLRSIGELVTEPLVEGLTQKLTGFENHGGGTVLGPDAKPLGRVLIGTGNGVPEGTAAPQERHDGVVQGNVIATYMHGPVLARNPELADLLLRRATNTDLEPLEVPGVEALRRERLASAATPPRE